MVEKAGQAGDCRVIEDIAGREFAAQCPADTGDQLDDKQRVAAQFEEVVVANRIGIDLQQGCEERAQGGIEGGFLKLRSLLVHVL
jgi:hypothetical protein